MSPYLFILITEGLSRSIHHQVNNGNLSGIRASKGGPCIGDLLFADDTLVFGRATETEANCIIKILYNYNKVSGQRVNEGKSEILFSKGTNNAVKDQICRNLGMRSTEKFQKYLGLPTVTGRSKQEIFQNIRTRLWKQVDIWNKGKISQAGKEILIKAVGQFSPYLHHGSLQTSSIHH